MDTLPTIALGIFVMAVVIIAAASLYFGPRITTAKIPMQWDTAGRPTWFAGRQIGLWWSLYFTVSVVSGIIVLAVLTDPDQSTKAWFAVIGVSVISAAAQVWHLNKVAHWAAQQ
jgi:hypothetical protein